MHLTISRPRGITRKEGWAFKPSNLGSRVSVPGTSLCHLRNGRSQRISCSCLIQGTHSGMLGPDAHLGQVIEPPEAPNKFSDKDSSRTEIYVSQEHLCELPGT